MAQLKTINVVQVIGGVVSSIHSFSDDEDGNKEAELLFKSIILEEEADEDYINEFIENRHYDKDDFDLLLTHSTQ